MAGAAGRGRRMARRGAEESQPRPKETPGRIAERHPHSSRQQGWPRPRRPPGQKSPYARDRRGRHGEMATGFVTSGRTRLALEPIAPSRRTRRAWAMDLPPLMKPWMTQLAATSSFSAFRGQMTMRQMIRTRLNPALALLTSSALTPKKMKPIPIWLPWLDET